jgi:hypothetical protein
VPHEPRRRQDLLCPLLTSASRSGRLSTASVTEVTRRRSPGVSAAAFRAQSPNLRVAPLMDTDFAVSRPLVRRARLLSGSCPSTRTFAPCFFQTPPRGGGPCIITRPSPPSGWPEDLHLQAAAHAQHTTKPLARRSPQPINRATIAWSRNSRAVNGVAQSRSRRPCSGVSQFPSRTPIRRTPFTRRIPATSSGPRRPASAASYATRRTAASRRLIVAGTCPRCSR